MTTTRQHEADVQPPLRYFLARAAKHWRWARTQGIRRLVEEDQLDPRERLRRAVRNRSWRRRHGAEPGTATAVFLVGLQRSGTNMLVRGLETAPEFEVHNENDRRAFSRYRLRPDARVAELVRASSHRYVLFKPLCDSHRVDSLLDDLALPVRPLAIWAYRDVDDRARSAVAKFGDANRQALRRIAAGDDSPHLWQGQRLSPESRDLIASFDLASMSAETAAALFWYVRNALFFELGLHERPDVLLSSYDELVADPQRCTRTLCDFLGFPWRPAVMAHVERRTPSDRPQLSLDPRVRALCTEMRHRLDGAALRD
jgi:hypothetical protein